MDEGVFHDKIINREASYKDAEDDAAGNDGVDDQDLQGTAGGPGAAGGDADKHEDCSDEDDDEDDDFECDIERYVPFSQKISFAEKIKHCSRDGLTQIMKIIAEIQPQAVDDYGNSRVQLKIDLIEREAFEKCWDVLTTHCNKQQRKSQSGCILDSMLND